jgi:hypothetical protein
VVAVSLKNSIALTKDGPFRGDGVYDDTGVGQRRSRTIAAGHTGRFFIDLGNDASFLDSFIVSGSGSSGPFEARYVVATTPVGPQVTGEGLSLSFVPAGDARLLRLSVSVADDAAAGRRRTWTITLTSAVDPAAVDVVRARVTTA